MTQSVALIGLLAGAVSCADPASTVRKTVVDIGVVGVENGRPEIEAPAAAAVGSTFVVEVTTVGDGCCSAERTDVDQTADAGDLTPYDRHLVPVEPTSTGPQRI